VEDLRGEGAIVSVPPQEKGRGFYSRLFIVPKKDGEQRPVLDCRALNRHLLFSSFKMESLKTVLDIIRPNDWMAKVDLRKAYLTIPIASYHQRLLRFTWKGAHYQFCGLPFGLSCAPLLFTKMLRPVIARWRAQGVRCVIYLDDLLVMAENQEGCQQSLEMILRDFLKLGLTPSFKKSIFVPARRVEYLGVELDSISKSISLPSRRLTGMRKAVTKALKSRQFSLRRLASLIGLLQSAMPAVQDARLHTRHLLRLRRDLWRRSYDWNKLVTLQREHVTELQWWAQQLASEGGHGRHLSAPMFPVTPAVTMESDASLTGWGASLVNFHPSLSRFFKRTSTRGFFSLRERMVSNNAREIMAALFAIRSFILPLPSRLSLPFRSRLCLVKTDNMVTSSYLNKEGGRKDHLSVMVEQTLALCTQKGWSMRAQYIPGVDNVVADRLSRHKYDRNDWLLRPSIFSQLRAEYGPLDMDLFASRLNAQLPLFAAWDPQPGALWTDSFSHTWDTRLVFYANPPFAIIQKVLRKILQDRATVLLILPLWRSAAWWPLLIHLLLRYTPLPRVNDLFLPGHRANHLPMEAPPWECGAFLVSGNRSWRTKGWTMQRWKQFNTPDRHRRGKRILLAGRSGSGIASDISSRS